MRELFRNGVQVSNPFSDIEFGPLSPTNPHVAFLTFTQPLIDGGYQLVGLPTIHDAFGDPIIGDANGAPSPWFIRNFYVGQMIGGQTDVAPVLSGIETTPESIIGPLDTPVTSLILAFDIDSSTFAGATIRFSQNYQNGEDVLNFASTAHITGVWDPGTGTMTLSGVDSVSNHWSRAMRSVTYHDTSLTPNTAVTRTISFTANDGLLDSNTVTRDLTVRADSGPPTLTGLGGSETFGQNGPPATIAPNLSASDPDGLNFASASVAFTNWQDGDRIQFYNSFALQHSFTEDLVNHTALLTLTGVDSPAHYQTELQSIQFYSVSGAPVGTPRIATFTVTDILSNSTQGSQTIHVTRVPLLSAIETAPLVYHANHPETSSTTGISATLLVADPDKRQFKSGDRSDLIRLSERCQES